MASQKKQQSTITAKRIDEAHNSGRDKVRVSCSTFVGFAYYKLPDRTDKKTGKVYRRGAWRFRYTAPTGKTRDYTIGNQTMALQTAIDYARKLDNDKATADLLGKPFDPLGDKEALEQEQREQAQEQARRQYMKLGKFFEDIYTPYQLARRRYGKGTLTTIKANFEHLFDRDMDKLTEADVRAWQSKRSELEDVYAEDETTGKAVLLYKRPATLHSTLEGYYGQLMTMLNYAVKQAKVLDVNPLQGVTLEEPTEAERNYLEDVHSHQLKEKRRALTKQELDAIEKGLELFADEVRESYRKHTTPPVKNGKGFEHWFIAFTRIAQLTGMRPSDIRELTWQNISFNKFDPNITFKPVKTRHKKNAIIVNFPIYDELEDVLKTWHTQQGSPSQGYLFKSERTGGVMDKKAYRRHWKRVKELGGAPSELEFYGLRHHWISERVADPSIPLQDIASLVGHKGTEMIAKHYHRPTHAQRLRAAAGARPVTEATQQGSAINE